MWYVVLRHHGLDASILARKLVHRIDLVTRGHCFGAVCFLVDS